MMKKIVMVVMLLLVACAPAQVVPSATEAPLTVPTSTLEPSPTADILPASLRENLPKLKQMGYTLQQGEGWWQLTSKDDQIVLRGADAQTITVQGDGELISFPEETFGVTETIGAGMKNLLTLADAEGDVTHTFLMRAGYWAPLAEIQRDPREIGDYPYVPIEALWNGLLAQTEALMAEPFGAKTLVPDKFVYHLVLSSQGYFVQLRDVVNGMDDTNYRYRLELLNKDNDYRRWTNFYRSKTPEGIEVLIATEQILMPDGRTSLFLHHIIGGERPWEGKNTLSSNKEDLIHNIFLARTEPAPEGSVSLAMRPVIFSSGYQDTEQWGISFTREPNAGISLYSLDQNDPTNIKEGLKEFFRNQYTNFDISIPNGPIGDAGNEVILLQYMGLVSYTAHGIFEEEYFNSP